MSAAATGVPNRAPIVAGRREQHRELARHLRQQPGEDRRPMSVALIAMIGFSGPRLTPPASASTVTSARPGSTLSFSGGGDELGRRRVGAAVPGHEA